MKAGLPIYKIDCFREVLEESGFRLTSRQHLRELVPFVHHQEYKAKSFDFIVMGDSMQELDWEQQRNIQVVMGRSCWSW